MLPGLKSLLIFMFQLKGDFIAPEIMDYFRSPIPIRCRATANVDGYAKPIPCHGAIGPRSNDASPGKRCRILVRGWQKNVGQLSWPGDRGIGFHLPNDRDGRLPTPGHAAITAVAEGVAHSLEAA